MNGQNRWWGNDNNIKRKRDAAVAWVHTNLRASYSAPQRITKVTTVYFMVPTVTDNTIVLMPWVTGDRKSRQPVLYADLFTPWVSLATGLAVAWHNERNPLSTLSPRYITLCRCRPTLISFFAFHFVHGICTFGNILLPELFYKPSFFLFFEYVNRLVSITIIICFGIRSRVIYLIFHGYPNIPNHLVHIQLSCVT